MDTDEIKNSIPLLTADTFIEWRFKMKNHLRGKDLFKKVAGEIFTERDERGRFKTIDDTWVNKALSIISSKIHRSLISTVTANGGEDDPIILLRNCMEFGSSKKNSNVFQAFRRLSNTQIDPTNITGSILKVRDAIAELKSLEIELNEQQLGHQLLDKIPLSLHSVQDVILATGQSDTVVTAELVLNMLDNKSKILGSSVDIKIKEEFERLNLKSSSTQPSSDSASAFHICVNGQHNPKANHHRNRCFQLFPELKEKQFGRSASNHNVEVVENNHVVVDDYEEVDAY